MEVQVLAIEPQTEPGSFDVVVAIDEVQRHFPIKVESVPIDDIELLVIKGDITFTQQLHGDIGIASAIRKLVARRYNGRSVKLPAVVGKIEEPVELATH